MQDTNNVVNEQVESTTSETSTISDSQTTNESMQDSSLSSSEDVNTQDDGSNGELESEALGQVKTDKGINRVQELANRAKAAENELAQLRQIQESSQQTYQQNAYQEPNPLLNSVVMQEIKLRNLENKLQFQEAESMFPQLNKRSSEYNIDFDNQVWNTVQQEGVSPVEAAKRVARLEKAIESRIAARMQKNESQKIVNSTGSVQRSNLNSGNDLYEARQREYNKNPTIQNLEKLLASKKS